MRALHEGAHPYRYENQNQVAFIQQQHEYLELHISEQDLKVETLIEMSGMTEEGYAKLLYQITQMTPREFVADYRLKKALGLLENSNDLIADIVFKCGYRDVGSFTREMKKKLGMTPSSYRDMLKRRD
jgi:AraC-like DNA-binding protein